LDGFIGITIHWIEKDWVPRGLILDMIEAPISRTSENLRAGMMKAAKQYGIHLFLSAGVIIHAVWDT
jgi:hypothetical protein